MIRETPPPDPRQLTGYTILSDLEQDEFATSFLAERQADHRLVVIKIPRPSMLIHLQHEADMVRRIRSPNCSGLIENGLDRPTPYLALGFIEGEPFIDWVQTQQPTLREIILILIQACEEVHQAAHLEGVYHLNIRPECLRVSTQGRVGWINFGTGGGATRLAADSGYSAGFHAPESLAGQARLKQDLVGLGQLIRFGCGGDPLPKPVPAHIPQPLVRIIERCQDQDPDHRYRTALEVAESLRLWANGRPVSADSWLDRGRTFLTRHRLAIILFTIGLIGIIFLTRIQLIRL